MAPPFHNRPILPFQTRPPRDSFSRRANRSFCGHLHSQKFCVTAGTQEEVIVLRCSKQGNLEIPRRSSIAGTTRLHLAVEMIVKNPGTTCSCTLSLHPQGSWRIRRRTRRNILSLYAHVPAIQLCACLSRTKCIDV